MSALRDRVFWDAAATRAIRTMAQTAISTIGTTAILTGVDWTMVASTTALAGILSVLNSLATGLPEVQPEIKVEEG